MPFMEPQSYYIRVIVILSISLSIRKEIWTPGMVYSKHLKDLYRVLLLIGKEHLLDKKLKAGASGQFER